MDALLPQRHPNLDFFVCDIFDVMMGFRDDQASMEHPIFSLQTKPDKRILNYEHNGKKIKIIPSGLGLATIHDKDILLYCMSYLRWAKKEEQPISKRLRLTSYDMLVSTNRQTNNLGYERLEAALNRLRGTTINTNIETGGLIHTKGFGLIEEWETVRKNGDGRLMSLEITLSDWLYNSILSDQLLSINKDYFRLRKPLERRLYEISRKHCGEQSEWAIGLEKLQKKTGSGAEKKKFRHYIKTIIEADRVQRYFPDYGLALNDNDVVIFKNRRPKRATFERSLFTFEPWVFEKAKEAAPGYDIYSLEREFEAWIKGKERPIKGYPAAFIGFCKQKPSI